MTNEIVLGENFPAASQETPTGLPIFATEHHPGKPDVKLVIMSEGNRQSITFPKAWIPMVTENLNALLE